MRLTTNGMGTKNTTSCTSHPILSRLWPSTAETSDLLLSPKLRAALFVAGIAGLCRQLVALFPPEVYQKDVRADYLPARALVDGVNPYLPMSQLAERYAPQIAMPDYVSKHPPFVKGITMPLGLVSYEVACAL